MTLPPTSESPVCRDRCANCGLELQGPFCHGCGQRKDEPEHWQTPVFLRNLVSEFTSMDSRFWRTMNTLVTKPGHLTKAFLSGQRGAFFTPTRVFIICSALYVLMGNRAVFQAEKLIAIQEGNQFPAIFQRLADLHQMPLDQFTNQFTVALQKRVKLLLPSIVFMFAIFLRIFFSGSKGDRTYVHHLIFSMHFVSFNFLVNTLFFVMLGWTHQLPLMAIPSGLLSMAYLYFALKKVYVDQSIGPVRTIGTYACYFLFKFVIIAMATATATLFP